MNPMKVTNLRNFKKKQEIIRIQSTKDSSIWLEATITEAKEVMQALQKGIMYAESNELIASFLRQNGMDEAQVETAITQLNKLREKL